MGLLLSRTYFHGENNSPQSAFYTDRLHNWSILSTLYNMTTFLSIIDCREGKEPFLWSLWNSVEEIWETIYDARRELNAAQDLAFPHNNKPYMNESLTHKLRELLYEVKTFKRNKQFKFFWRRHGKVFLKKDDSPATQIKSFATMDEFNVFKDNYVAPNGEWIQLSYVLLYNNLLTHKWQPITFCNICNDKGRFNLCGINVKLTSLFMT